MILFVVAHMKACVIGGGPSGIFVSKYLSASGIDVDLFEKSDSLMGNYKYARDGIDLTKENLGNPRIAVHLNSTEKSIDDSLCDFYILATGAKPKELGIEGKEHIVNAIDIIKEHYKNGHGGCPVKTGNARACIIGMGNVSLDLIYHLKDCARSITVLGRNKLKDAAFDNHVMRDLINSNNFEIRISNVGSNEPANDKKTERRLGMFRNSSVMAKLTRWIEKILNLKKKPVVDLIFESEVESVKQTTGANCSKKSLAVSYKMGSGLKEDVFDCVISSIGFIPNVPDVKTNKKVYKVGWCEYPRGNIGDSQSAAKSVVDRIIRESKNRE